MSSLLVVTFDSAAVTAISSVAAGYRVRNVGAVDTAREWLAMQRFDVLLVDGRIGQGAPLELLELGWKHNPQMLGALFHIGGRVDDEWPARLSGARIFSGEKALLGIQQMLENRPNWDVEQLQNGVLLVEDLDSPRDIICSYIESMGWKPVVGVGSGDEALRVLQSDHARFIAVVADIHMPKMNGIELVQRIRSDSEIEYLPVIMLTAHATIENLIECIKAGASGFLVKPPRKNLLSAELEKARRILATKESPRLCEPEDALQFQAAVERLFQTA